MGYMGIWGRKEYVFLAVLVRNRVLILPILVANEGMYFYTQVLNWVCFLEEATFSSWLW